MTRKIGLAATVALAITIPTPHLSAQDTSAVSLENLAWIAGHWTGDAFGGQAEEGWFAPSGGSMSGLFRLVSGGQARVFELLLIEQEGEEIFFRFKHIRPGWVPVEEEEALSYRLVRLEGQHAFFESTSDQPRQGAPKSFSYARVHADSLIVDAQTWDGDDFEIRMSRVP
jgi:hypothetical protein